MRILPIICLSFCFLVACSNSKQKKDTPKNNAVIKKTNTLSKKKVKAKKVNPVVINDKGESVVTLSSNDVMKFSAKKISVKAGKKVILTLKHTGKLDKKVMGHNFVLLKQGVKLSTFASKAAASKANDYIPVSSSDVIVHTKMIGGGETTTIEFDAPAKGTYDFICSFPAHYAMMKGKFIVE